MEQTTYLLHQTPRELATDLIRHTPLSDGDIVLEPFRGDGAFYDALPSGVQKEWCETTQGRDYQSHTEPIDWVVSNPPYRIDQDDGKRINAVWMLLDYFSPRVRKGIGFLINDKCFSALTPRRLEILAERGLRMTHLIVCSVKKWRGRYYYIVFQRTEHSPIFALRTNY